MKKTILFLFLFFLYHTFIGLSHFNRLEFGDTTDNYHAWVFQINHFINYGEIPTWEPYTIGGYNFLYDSFNVAVNSPIFLSYLFIVRLIHKMGISLDIHTIYKIC